MKQEESSVSSVLVLHCRLSFIDPHWEINFLHLTHVKD